MVNVPEGPAKAEVEKDTIAVHNKNSIVGRKKCFGFIVIPFLLIKINMPPRHRATLHRIYDFGSRCAIYDMIYI